MQVNTSENIYIRERVIIKFWPLASLVLVIFILESFFISKNYLSGSIHLANLLFITVSIFICLRAKKVLLACNLLAAIGMITIMTFLFTGGPANTGFWWSIVYVVGVFLVTSKKWAIFWLSLYVVATLTIAGLSLAGAVTLAYAIPELLHLLIVFIITFAFVYYFNQVCEYYLGLANKRAEELARLNHELTSANKELEEFAYVASHDLQEPLQTITNFTGLLEKQYTGKLDGDADQYLGFILNASSKMKALIKDLLDLSRVGRDVAFTTVDCNHVLKDVVAQMKVSIQQNKVKIHSSSLPVVQANEMGLRQLFQNLVSNALKFRVKDVDPEIEIAVEEKMDEYLFSFKDNGIGIEEKYKNRIFIIFQRLHSADEYPGTGIGLAVCKKIIAQHKGKIWVESEPGKGSIFYFTLARQNQF
jgi:signal transduction histidine kinase